MARIILVRHGETEWNKQEVFRGTIDVELNSAGLKQAQAVGEELKNRTNRHRTTKVRVSGLELPIVNPLIRFVFMDTQFMVIHCVLEKIVVVLSSSHLYSRPWAFISEIMWSSITESRTTGSVPSSREFGDSSGNVFQGLGAQTLLCQLANRASAILSRHKQQD